MKGTPSLRGTASVSKDGLTLTQQAAVTSGVVGNTYAPKFNQVDLVDFNVPATMTITEAQASINTQAAAWVSATYPTIA
jgi:hypothetical protein